ncbi:hypothetical protein ABDK56_07590 [Sphingomonas sp. ASV193]|uniref:hypothetical protein n=1 Tax=Sphingomonas sp. ASV193 TaxID=3144405 RepID=UPI0032E8F78B
MNWADQHKKIYASIAKALSFIKKHWLVIGTTLVLFFASAIWYRNGENDAASIATFISGFATALAFLWLAAGFRLQTEELSLQRQELQLQRIAAQQQATELLNASKLSSLGQVHTLIRDAEEVVRMSPLDISVTDLPGIYMSAIEYWTATEKSKDPKTVINNYNEWLKREVVCKNYIKNIASAMKIYIEHHCRSLVIQEREKDEEFVYIHESWVRKAPYISQHIGVASLLGNFMFMLSPGVERALLAFSVANAKLIGMDMFKEGALESMRDKVLERSESLPAICDPWPNQK